MMPVSPKRLRLVDHDRATGNGFWIRVVHVRLPIDVVVEDHRVAVVGPGDPDPELVHTTTAADITVVRSQGEVVVARAVDRAAALVLRLVARDDEPRVRRR